MRRTKTPGVRQVGPGLYFGRVVVQHPKTGKRKEIVRKTLRATSTLDARQKMLALRADFLAGVQSRPVASTTLGSSMRSWLDTAAPGLRASTLATYGTAVKRWCGAQVHEARLGDYLVELLEPADIRAALASMPGEALTRNGYLRVIRTWARATGHERVTAGVRALALPKPSLDGDADARRGLRLAEVRGLLRVGPKVAGTWWPLLATLTMTGMRFSEASPLRWSDVDLREAVIRIRRSQVRGAIAEPKSRAGKRDVTIPAELVAILRAHRRRTRGFEQVFPAARGAAFVSNTGLRKIALRVLVAAKIERGDRPAIHCLRHAWVNAIRQVADDTVRISLVGHADAESGEPYVAADQHEKHEAARKAMRLIQGGRG